jgi:hypothetical protein
MIMVDLALLQSLSYMAGAVGVCVAAFYYAMTLRDNSKKRQIDLVLNLQNYLNSEEMWKKFREIMYMEYKDYDEFEKKYGSDTNPENFVQRMNLWCAYNTLGYLMRKGMLDPDTVWALQSDGPLYTWEKCRDLIYEAKRRYNGKSYMDDFEYLAGEMMKLKQKHDPEYKVPETLSKYVPDKN